MTRNTEFVGVRVTERDREWIDKEAEREGLNASSFIRMTLRRERTQRERRAAEQPAVAA